MHSLLDCQDFPCYLNQKEDKLKLPYSHAKQQSKQDSISLNEEDGQKVLKEDNAFLLD